MEFLESLKMFSLWGNTSYDYFIAAIIFISLIVILKTFQVIVLARLHKLALRTKTDLDDMLIEVFKTIKPPFYFFISVYFSIKILSVPDVFNKILLILFLVVIVFEIIQAIARVLDYIMRKYLNKNKEEGEDNQHADSVIKLLQVIVKVILWVLGLVLILSNLGLDVTSLIAGMGIGGLAIALALQNVLSDLFSAFSIYIDKPFKAGDFIKFASHTKVYMVVADVQASSNASTVTIEPPLIETVADDSVVTYDNVPFTVYLTNDIQEFGVSGVSNDGKLYYEYQFDVEEAL